MLAREVVEALKPGPGKVYVDCTAGLGGHAAAVAEHLRPDGTIVLNDADPANLKRATERLQAVGGVRVIPYRANFAELPRLVHEAGLKADMVLADLGFASNQIDDAARGFSFMRDGPLDMRLDPSLPTSARDLVSSIGESELADLIYELGEEPASRRIARKLVQARSAAPITTTLQLAALVREAVLGRSSTGNPGGINPATRTFQALRIAVNDELGSLEALLAAVGSDARAIHRGRGGEWLSAGARVAIISFHSLEDRPVKRVFGELSKGGCVTEVTEKPVTASDEEVAFNPRARSAKLRVIRVGMGGTSA